MDVTAARWPLNLTHLGLPPAPVACSSSFNLVTSVLDWPSSCHPRGLVACEFDCLASTHSPRAPSWNTTSLRSCSRAHRLRGSPPAQTLKHHSRHFTFCLLSLKVCELFIIQIKCEIRATGLVGPNGVLGKCFHELHHKNQRGISNPVEFGEPGGCPVLRQEGQQGGGMPHSFAVCTEDKHGSWQAPELGETHMGGTCRPSGAPGTGGPPVQNRSPDALAERGAAWTRCPGEPQALTPSACCDREAQRLGKPVSHSQ